MNKIDRFFNKYINDCHPAKVIKIDARTIYIDVQLPNWVILNVSSWQFVIGLNAYVLLQKSFSYYSIKTPISEEDYNYFIK